MRISNSQKAQLQQIFIYISAILVIGFIVLFGYRMIGKVLDQKCSVEEQDFMLSIASYVDQNIRYGSVDEAVLTTPCDYNVLCFVDASVIGTATWTAPAINLDGVVNTAIIQANVQDNISYNVYLYQSKGLGYTYPVAYDERVHISDQSGMLCMKPIAGSFRFMVEGQGKNGVMLSASG